MVSRSYGPIPCFMVEHVGESGEWRRVDTGEVFPSNASLPVGAMWDAHWYRDNNPADGFHFWNPVDGQNLVVRLPNGHDWYIDGRANNCDQKDRPHRCWVRHGVAPAITVDKSGDTCTAGAGSILVGDYHGFLRGGILVDC